MDANTLLKFVVSKKFCFGKQIKEINTYIQQGCINSIDSKDIYVTKLFYFR